MEKRILSLVFISLILSSCTEKMEKYYPSGALHWIGYGPKNDPDSIIMYYENGKLSSKTYFKNKHDWKQFKYSESGHLRYIRNITDGKLNGFVFSISKNGDTLIKEQFNMDTLIDIKYYYNQDTILNMCLWTPKDTFKLSMNQKQRVFMACFSPKGLDKRLYLSEYKGENIKTGKDIWNNIRTLPLKDGYLSKFDTSFATEGMHSLIYFLEGVDKNGELKGLKAKQVVFIVK